MSAQHNALRAVSYTHRVLGELPSNHLVQRIITLGGSTECVQGPSGLRASVGPTMDHDLIMNLRRLAAAAKARRCGNCGEYAAVAFDFLMLTNCLCPIEYAYYEDPGDHAFVIVGRPLDSVVRDPSTWGPDAVVCDAWAGEVVPAHAYWTSMPAFPNAIHHPQVVVRWGDLGDYPTTARPGTAA